MYVHTSHVHALYAYAFACVHIQYTCVYSTLKIQIFVFKDWNNKNVQDYNHVRPKTIRMSRIRYASGYWYFYLTSWEFFQNQYPLTGPTGLRFEHHRRNSVRTVLKPSAHTYIRLSSLLHYPTQRISRDHLLHSNREEEIGAAAARIGRRFSF